jgi:tight adherence protein B
VVLVTGAMAGLLAFGAVLVALPRRPLRHAPGRRPWPPPGDLLASLPRWVELRMPRRRRRRRDHQLPEALDRAAAALRSGDSLGVALERVAVATPAPLGTELRRVAKAVALGAPTSEALRAWSAGSGASADVQLVATALAIGATAGGELARAVDGVASTVRERHELRREVQALATQARASAGVLAAAPPAFAALVASIEPRAALFLFTEPIGLLCLGGGLALEAGGAVWMARITRGAG